MKKKLAIQQKVHQDTVLQERAMAQRRLKLALAEAQKACSSELHAIQLKGGCQDRTQDVMNSGSKPAGSGTDNPDVEHVQKLKRKLERSRQEADDATKDAERLQQ